MAITAEDNRKQMETLKCSYEMYEETKKTTLKSMKTATNEDGTKKFTQEDIDNEMKLIEEAQADVLMKYEMFGGDPEELKKAKKKKTNKSIAKNVLDMVSKEIEEKTGEDNVTPIIEENFLPSKQDYDPHNSFDVIPLPSKGECYKNKKSKIAVEYLTAYDENMIISPNLYRDNLILDYLVNEKVVDNIDTGELLEGDRDAIILFLRASGYGNEYPITATDNETGVEFDTVIDLSKLKFKEFNLKGDENGWFDFKLPLSQRDVKFRFLTHKDMQTLDKVDEIETKRLMKERLRMIVETLDTFVENETNIDKNEKAKVRQAIRTIDNWQEGLDDDIALKYTHVVTNRLELQVMAVDGNTDRKYVREFVRNMSVRDSSALRKYIAANEPGIDYNIEIEKPESLGGGSMRVFLQLDQYLFLNVAE